MSGGNGTTQIDPTKWADITTLPPPPGITPDTPITGMSPAELAAMLLSAAAALDDPKDQADAQAGHAKRTAASADTAAQFPEQEGQQAGKMDGLGQESQMAQQIPQMLSSVGGALSGALGGLMQPLTQMPQQLAQTGQQLLQQGMGAMKDTGGKTPEGLAGDGLGGGLPGAEDASKLGEGEGGGGSGGGGGSTTPTAMLGPPATPSAATTPTSGRAMPAAPASSGPATAAPAGGMGGMPMMPHGGMSGGGGEGKDDKAATKRVAVPSIKNGAPVQGRIAAPPSAPTVAKKVDGKTVASKRIVVPSDRANDKTEGDDKDR